MPKLLTPLCLQHWARQDGRVPPFLSSSSEQADSQGTRPGTGRPPQQPPVLPPAAFSSGLARETGNNERAIRRLPPAPVTPQHRPRHHGRGPGDQRDPPPLPRDTRRGGIPGPSRPQGERRGARIAASLGHAGARRPGPGSHRRSRSPGPGGAVRGGPRHRQTPGSAARPGSTPHSRVVGTAGCGVPPPHRAAGGGADPHGSPACSTGDTCSRLRRSASTSRCRRSARSSASSACCCSTWILRFTASMVVAPAILPSRPVPSRPTDPRCAGPALKYRNPPPRPHRPGSDVTSPTCVAVETESNRPVWGHRGGPGGRGGTGICPTVGWVRWDLPHRGPRAWALPPHSPGSLPHTGLRLLPHVGACTPRGPAAVRPRERHAAGAAPGPPCQPRGPYTGTAGPPHSQGLSSCTASPHTRSCPGEPPQPTRPKTLQPCGRSCFPPSSPGTGLWRLLAPQSCSAEHWCQAPPPQTHCCNSFSCC